MRAKGVALGALLMAAIAVSVWLARRSPPTSRPSDAGSRATDLGRPVADLAAQEISAEEGRAFVEAWTRAFNRHDFTAFAALYDSAFESTTLVHGAPLKYDQWMADRQGLLERKAQVWTGCFAAEPLAGGTLEVSVEQTLRIGAAVDYKRKSFVLARQGDRLAVLREDIVPQPLGAPDKDSQVYAQLLHRDTRSNPWRVGELPIIDAAIDETESDIAVVLFFPEHEELAWVRRNEDGTQEVVARSAKLDECKEEIKWVEADGERAIELSTGDEVRDEPQHKSLFALDGERLVRVASYERYEPPCSVSCDVRRRPEIHAQHLPDGKVKWRVRVREVSLKEACNDVCGD
jgi:hypothetical protein